MIGTLLLVLLGLLTAAVWPLQRWALRRGGSPSGVGIVLSLLALAGGLMAARITDRAFYDPTASFLGALGGLAYGVGNVLLILRCLSLGPAGPTVVVTGLAAAAPVLLGLLMPGAAGMPGPPVAVLVGLGSAGVSILVLVAAPPMRGASADRPRSAPWSARIAMGWLFCSLAALTQTLSGRYAPHAPFAYFIAQYLVCLLCLLTVASARNAWPRLPDLAAGAGTAAVTALVVPVGFSALAGVEARAIFPLIAIAPAVVMLVLGWLAYRERLSAWAWIGSAAGVAGIILLSSAAA